MPITATKYRYTALENGATIKGTLEAESSYQARTALTDRSLIPLHVELVEQGARRELHIPGLGNRVRAKDLAMFSRQMESMIAAGLPILRALEVAADQSDKIAITRTATDVKSDVRAGSPLSEALAKHPAVFPSIMTGIIRAGETGGFLEEAFAQIAVMYESDAKLRSKVKSALAYPVVVLAFAVLMVGALMVFILPIFEGMFQSLGGQLPLPTRILIGAANNLFWIAPAVVIAAVAAWRLYRIRYRSSSDFRLKIDMLKHRTPMVGKLMSKVALARWARNLSTLLAVGVTLPRALEIVGDTSGNEIIARAMRSVQDTVTAGGRMSEALDDDPFFPKLVVQMAGTGEETGSIPPMLDRVSDYYSREAESLTDSITSLIEPLMIVVLGSIVGTVVVCLYLPMFTIYQSIG